MKVTAGNGWSYIMDIEPIKFCDRCWSKFYSGKLIPDEIYEVERLQECPKCINYEFYSDELIDLMVKNMDHSDVSRSPQLVRKIWKRIKNGH
jgi:predicted nucleic-acid-binding Zn-ribbon protein